MKKGVNNFSMNTPTLALHESMELHEALNFKTHCLAKKGDRVDHPFQHRMRRMLFLQKSAGKPM